MIAHTQKVEWDKLLFSRYLPKRSEEGSTKKDIIALDTETLNGYAKILCDSEGNIINIEEKKTDVMEILSFLTSARYYKTINCFYNLKYDAGVLFKHFSKLDKTKLYDTSELEIGEYKIFLLPSKMMNITYKRKTYRYYDIAQFFNMSLEKAAIKYLTENRKDSNGLDVEQIGSSLQYWKDNCFDIVNYCFQDCKVTKELGELLNNTAVELGITPKNFVSAASFSKLNFKIRCDFPDLTKTSNVPLGAIIQAYLSYSGGWFEMFKRGTFKDTVIVDHDINSAYATAIYNMVDINHGEWKRTKKYNPDCSLGFYHVIVNVPEHMYISPIPLRLKGGTIIRPTGEFMTSLTNIEIESYKDYVDIEVLSGWEFFDENPQYPFREEITRLYDMKQQIKENGKGDTFNYDLVKKILNSLYGNTFQKNPFKRSDFEHHRNKTHKTGTLFNPIMASFITAYCRVMIWDMIKDQTHKVIGIATDGILCLDGLTQENNLELGGWETSKSDSLLMLQPGIYEKGNIVKTRGFEKDREIYTPKGNHYKNVMEYIRKEPELLDYPMMVKRVYSMKQALHSKKYGEEDAMLFISKEIKKSLNSDVRRKWETDFKNGADLLSRNIDSIPLHMG